MVTLLKEGKSLRPAEPRRLEPDSDKAPASVSKFIKLVTSAVDLQDAAIAYDKQLLPS